MMTDTIAKIMVDLLLVLALVTKQIQQGRFGKCAITYILPVAQYAIEKFEKEAIGVEAVLQTRSINPDARMIVAQTLGVVHGFVGNMQVVMEVFACL